MPLELIKTLLDGFNGIVVVDEAYVDFSEEESALSLLKDYPQLLVCQTFSKAYGLAGIRLGMCFAHPSVIDYFNKIKPPYNVNALSQEQALARLADYKTVQEQVGPAHRGTKKLDKALIQIDFIVKIYPSDANFLLMEVDDADKRYNQFLAAGSGPQKPFAFTRL